ncbi:MAG: hypothetical protein JXA73_06310 [Acidobacteria bacterium]|nr:hypothetical protein [Acidobacteriota bacterium]
MELTYESILKWFEGYFEEVRRSQGAIETVSNLKKYFATDLELTMYTAPGTPHVKTMSRDSLLLSFVHPGLHEDIIPRCYVIDVKQMAVVVQFEIRFRDKISRKEWIPLQASAHYHLGMDAKHELKIKRIHYWTEPLPEDLFEIWFKYRDEALATLALGFINAKS